MGLLVIPSIDIHHGQTVRVVQGIPELAFPGYSNDPLEMALLWRTENAKFLHIVDFDAAFSTGFSNLNIIEEICNNLIIPVEYSGGIRTLEDAENIFSLGVSRIALATLVYDNFNEFVKIIEKLTPSKVVVCIDSIDGEVVVRGRKEKTGLSVEKYLDKIIPTGVQRYIVTDVQRNGLMTGPNIELCLAVAKQTGKKVTLSGGIANKDELLEVQKYLDQGIDSVIIGRALYENRFPCQKLWRISETPWS